MKRCLTFGLIVVLAVGSLALPAQAKKKPSKNAHHVYNLTYLCPCPGLFELGGTTGTNIGGGMIPTTSTDRYLSAVATDTSGQPVPVALGQNVDGSSETPVGSFCGKTDGPIAITPGAELEVVISPYLGCPGPAVAGTIHIVLSK